MPRSNAVTVREPIEYDDAPPVKRASIAASIAASSVAADAMPASVTGWRANQQEAGGVALLWCGNEKRRLSFLRRLVGYFRRFSFSLFTALHSAFIGPVQIHTPSSTVIHSKSRSLCLYVLIDDLENPVSSSRIFPFCFNAISTFSPMVLLGLPILKSTVSPFRLTRPTDNFVSAARAAINRLPDLCRVAHSTARCVMPAISNAIASFLEHGSDSFRIFNASVIHLYFATPRPPC